MKKFVSLLMCICMLLGMAAFSGCGASDEPAGGTSDVYKRQPQERFERQKLSLGHPNETDLNDAKNAVRSFLQKL